MERTPLDRLRRRLAVVQAPCPVWKDLMHRDPFDIRMTPTRLTRLPASLRTAFERPHAQYQLPRVQDRFGSRPWW
jgi:hypothetical protein